MHIGRRLSSKLIYYCLHSEHSKRDKYHNMAGVAGRSKACTTCKLRHVRCGGFQCQGYYRPLRFITSTWRSAKNSPLPQRGGSTRSPSRLEDMKGHADNHNVGNTTLSRPTTDDSFSLDTSPLGQSFQYCLRIWPSNDVVFTTSYAHVAIATTATGDNISTHFGSSAPIIGSRDSALLHREQCNPDTESQCITIDGCHEHGAF
ncbi:hypothetical protein J3F84DRAFT_391635 [Trichoderma pleuroticola]